MVEHTIQNQTFKLRFFLKILQDILKEPKAFGTCHRFYYPLLSKCLYYFVQYPKYFFARYYYLFHYLYYICLDDLQAFPEPSDPSGSSSPAKHGVYSIGHKNKSAFLNADKTWDKGFMQWFMQ